MQHAITGVLQLLILAILLPVLGDGSLAVLMLSLVVLHPRQIPAITQALLRARWLFVALFVAATLPALMVSAELSVELMAAAGARLAPITLLIVAVTVWVSPFEPELLSAAIERLLRPLTAVGVDVTGAATVVAGTLAAIPATLTEVQAARSATTGHLDAMAALVLDAERRDSRSRLTGTTTLQPIRRGPLLLFASWLLLFFILVFMGL